ncbi:MAG: hypothetical protein AB1716_01370 [Planctomycetota bacterium]
MHETESGFENAEPQLPAGLREALREMHAGPPVPRARDEAILRAAREQLRAAAGTGAGGEAIRTLHVRPRGVRRAMRWLPYATVAAAAAALVLAVWLGMEGRQARRSDRSGDGLTAVVDSRARAPGADAGGEQRFDQRFATDAEKRGVPGATGEGAAVNEPAVAVRREGDDLARAKGGDATAQMASAKGRVTILDAFALARRLKAAEALAARDDHNGDGLVDRRDIDALALAAVRLTNGS